jgi:hypothetical protein
MIPTSPRTLFSFVGAFALAFFVQTRVLAQTTAPKEMVFVGRPASVRSYDELIADEALRDVQQTVDEWLDAQVPGEWEPNDLARFLRTRYETVELEPSGEPGYEYVTDSTGVVHRICTQVTLLLLVPAPGERRVSVRLQRWMELD